MCEFISYIGKETDKGAKVLFLTYDRIFNTPRGEILRKEIGSNNPEDFYGHAAIRKYYQAEGGKDKECTDFSTPTNFPPTIARAIKGGDFKGFPLPIGLLSQPLNDQRWVDRKALNDKNWDLFISNPANKAEAWR